MSASACETGHRWWTKYGVVDIWFARYIISDVELFSLITSMILAIVEEWSPISKTEWEKKMQLNRYDMVWYVESGSRASSSSFTMSNNIIIIGNDTSISHWISMSCSTVHSSKSQYRSKQTKSLNLPLAGTILSGSWQQIINGYVLCVTKQTDTWFMGWRSTL